MRHRAPMPTTAPESPPPVTLGRVREAFEAFDQGDPRAALEELLRLYHPDVRFRDPLQETRGLPAFRKAMVGFVRLARGLRVEVEDGARGGDTIFLRWTMRFRPGRAPASIAIEGVSHLRLRDGLIVDHRDYWDLLESLAESMPLAAAAWRRLRGLLA